LLKYSQNTTGVYFFLPHPVDRKLSPVLATVVEFGDYSRQCGQDLKRFRDCVTKITTSLP